MKKKILIADDEESIRYTFYEFLSEEGYQVSTVDSLQECLAQLQKEEIDLLFLDINWGCENGLDAITEIKRAQPHCSIIMITGALDCRAIQQARSQGARDYLVKPIRRASLTYIASRELSKNPKTVVRA